LVKKATDTATIEGRWNEAARVSEPPIISRIEKAMMIKETRGYQEAEADVAGGLGEGLAGGELTCVDAVNGFVAQQEGQVRHRIEDSVSHSSG
jgi:hypothetical protein